MIGAPGGIGYGLYIPKRNRTLDRSTDVPSSTEVLSV